MSRPLLAPALVLLGGVSFCRPAAAADAVVVIVNPSVPGVSIARKILASIYMKEVVRWSNGTAIEPIDQSASSPLRAQFTQLAFAQPVAWVTHYWVKQMSSGKGWPPAVKTSDAEVIAHVARSKGAIGYVAPTAQLDESVKVVKVIE